MANRSVAAASQMRALSSPLRVIVIHPQPGREIPVPTLFRLLFVIALLAALVYGGMLALVTFGTPDQRQISTPIELPKQPR